MSPVALRIVDDLSYVTRINHESHFAWQAQHLVIGDVGAPRLANANFVVTRSSTGVVLCSAE